ncbi:MAG: hypothetical protein WC966_03555 [Bradymonadales bacterium]|jgi:hypothetical protein
MAKSYPYKNKDDISITYIDVDAKAESYMERMSSLVSADDVPILNEIAAILLPRKPDALYTLVDDLLKTFDEDTEPELLMAVADIALDSGISGTDKYFRWANANKFFPKLRWRMLIAMLQKSELKKDNIQQTLERAIKNESNGKYGADFVVDVLSDKSVLDKEYAASLVSEAIEADPSGRLSWMLAKAKWLAGDSIAASSFDQDELLKRAADRSLTGEKGTFALAYALMHLEALNYTYPDKEQNTNGSYCSFNKYYLDESKRCNLSARLKDFDAVTKENCEAVCFVLQESDPCDPGPYDNRVEEFEERKDSCEEQCKNNAFKIDNPSEDIGLEYLQKAIEVIAGDQSKKHFEKNATLYTRLESKKLRPAEELFLWRALAISVLERLASSNPSETKIVDAVDVEIFHNVKAKKPISQAKVDELKALLQVDDFDKKLSKILKKI